MNMCYIINPIENVNIIELIVFSFKLFPINTGIGMHFPKLNACLH